MSINPLNDISSVYLKEVFEPQLGKKAPSSGGTKKVEKGKDDAESSAKRIRQAVYDIRYRARREDIKLDQAFNQYMSHTTMTGPEKTAVKEKLGLITGAVSEEVEQKKFKVRVTDKSSGKSYVRYATREKINKLRANPNIKSVEMTSYGQPYEGERKKGEQTAKATAGKDWDGDGKVESGAKEYRGVIHNKIQQKKGGKPDGKDTSNVREGFSNWREDLCEVMDKIKKPETDQKMITGKGGKPAKITINPTLPEAIENLGGELIEMVEIDEAQMTGAEKKEEKKLKKKYDPSGMKASMVKQYGPEKGKSVYFATIRKKAMQNAGYEPEGDTIQELATTKPEQTTPNKPQQNTSAINAVLTAKRNEAAAKQKSAQALKTAAQKGVDVASISSSYEMEGELVDELTRYAKETGKSFRTGKPTSSGGTMGGSDTRSQALRSVMKSMGSGRMGVQPRGKKKVPGQKPPAAGQPGSGVKSPAQKVALRRDAAKRAVDAQSSRFD